MDAEDAALVAAWRRAASDPRIEALLTGIHDRIAAEVRARRPLCLASGQCCHFERYGHRLYVTGLETAWTLRVRAEGGAGLPTIADVDAALDRGDCPFLVDGRRCGAHLERPIGCRIYFCDRSASWQEDLHEELHRSLVAIHESHAIPYRYGEWRAMLRLVLQH